MVICQSYTIINFCVNLVKIPTLDKEVFARGCKYETKCIMCGRSTCIKNTLAFGKGLTVLTLNSPWKECFLKHCGKRRKCWLPAFSPLPTMFSTPLMRNFWGFLSHLFGSLQMLFM